MDRDFRLVWRICGFIEHPARRRHPPPDSLGDPFMAGNRIVYEPGFGWTSHRLYVGPPGEVPAGITLVVYDPAGSHDASEAAGAIQRALAAPTNAPNHADTPGGES